MKILSRLKSLLSLRTSRKKTALLGGAAFLLLAGALVAGPTLLDLAGDGAGWVVGRVVRAVAYREVSPAGDEATTMHSRIRVASSAGLPEAVTAGVPAAAEGAPPAAETPEPEPDSIESLPPLDLVTPFEEETMPPREETPPYRSFGLRDPMIPLVTADGELDEETQFSVYRLVLVGVAWRNGMRVGLLEDAARKSYLYRVGDWTKDGGRVVDLTENSITFSHVRYGEMTRFTLRLMPREEEQ